MEESGQSVHFLEALEGHPRRVAVIAHVTPDCRPVLLFHEGVVVLLVGTGATEPDPLLLAVGEQVVVDELATVVGVEVQEGEWQGASHLMHGASYPLLALAPHRAAARPAFGALLAVQVRQLWELMGSPSRFHVVEVGAG